MPRHPVNHAACSAVFVLACASSGAPPAGEDIVHVAAMPAVPPARVRDGVRRVRVQMTVQDTPVTGTRYARWTIHGQVPAPFIRARVGDTLQWTLINAAANRLPHDVETTDAQVLLHVPFAVPGRGSTRDFALRGGGALVLYVDGAGPAGVDAGNGVYGLLLVEPAGGLPSTRHEWSWVHDPGNPWTGVATRPREGDTVRLFIGNAAHDTLRGIRAVSEVIPGARPSEDTPGNPEREPMIASGGAAAIVIRFVDAVGHYEWQRVELSSTGPARPSATDVKPVPSAASVVPISTDPEPGMVYVPAGFMIDARPTTRRSFAAFVREHPEWRRANVARLFADERYLSDWVTDDEPGRPEQPVTHVSWFAGEEYCRARGMHLPTIRQWETAAGGEDEESAMIHARTLQHYQSMTPVHGESTWPNSWGVHDMPDGNWEWNLDFPVDDEPRRTGTRPSAIFCGEPDAADSAGEATFLRNAFRASMKPREAHPALGFRCAREVRAP